MDIDQFRREGKRMVDWIADYLESVEDYPVLSQVAPGEVAAQLPAQAPENGESFGAIFKDLDEIILPGITHWQSPGFFAYFPSNSSPASILGELASAGLGAQGMLWATSPACTEVETRVLDWLVDLLDLPQGFKSTTQGGGVIQDTASSASLCALLAARERKLDFTGVDQGIPLGLTAYTSSQAHSSLAKAAMIAGIGKENMRGVQVGHDFAMDPAGLRRAIEADLAAGLKPFFVCATVGTTSSNAIDPVAAIGEICREFDLWLHVDAAMSGTASLCPEFRWIHQGLELADSYCFNPHKWMFTNFDCDAFWVRDRQALLRTLSILPDYLKNQATESGAVIDYRDWQVPLGRRFRALKLWFVLRHYGAEKLRQWVRQHVGMAQQFARWVRETDAYALVIDPPLNLVCIRHRAGDEATRRILHAVNASGRAYLTHTVLDGVYVMRVSIGQWRQHPRHIEALQQQLLELASDLDRT